MTLTKKQKLVLDFITRFIDQQGYVPSYEEIAHGLGLASVSTIHAHVENLRSKGYLSRKWNAHRSLDLNVAEVQPPTEIHLLGSVAAGFPIEAVLNPEKIGVPKFLMNDPGMYALRVTGDSMRDDHIIDGDIILLESRNIARDGELVVALIDNESATLKRYFRQGAVIELQPSNPDYPPQEYAEHRVKVQGIVKGILRKY